MNPLLVVAAGLFGSTLVGLQTWLLREVYAIRVSLTRMEAQHAALAEQRLTDRADLVALALRVAAIEAHR